MIERNDNLLVWSKQMFTHLSNPASQWYCECFDLSKNQWTLKEYQSRPMPGTETCIEKYRSEDEARAALAKRYRHEDISWHESYSVKGRKLWDMHYHISVKKILNVNGWYLDVVKHGSPNHPGPSSHFVFKNESLENCIFLGDRLVVLMLKNKKAWNSWYDSYKKSLRDNELIAFTKEKGFYN